MAKHTVKPQSSNREQEHAAMLKEALARLGLCEVMQVYQNYQQANKGLNSYRLATKHPEKLLTTDRTNLHKACVKST